MRSGRVLRWFFAALSLGAGCSVDVDLTGKGCPCADGWQCDPSTSRCVPNRLGLASAIGPMDIVVVPERLTIAQGAVGTLEVSAARVDLGTFSVAIEIAGDVTVTRPVETLTGTGPVVFQIQPDATAPTRTLPLIVHAFRAAGDEGVRKSVELQIVGRSGSPDTTFGVGGMLATNVPCGGDMDVVEMDGRFTVAARGNAAEATVLTRVGSDGSVDATFGGGRVVWPFANARIARRGDTVTVAGSGDAASPLPSYTSTAVQRMAANGTPDPSFNGGRAAKFSIGTNSIVHGVALADDGGAIVAASSGNTHMLARLTEAGSLMASFGSGGMASVGMLVIRAMAVMPSGAIVAAGFDPYAPSPLPIVLRRFEADGRLDATFGTAGTTIIKAPDATIVFALAPTRAGGLVVFGQAAPTGGVVYRVDADGRLDMTFGDEGVALPPPGNTVRWFADGVVLDDDSIAAVGDGANAVVLSRFDATGRLYPTLGDSEVRFPGGETFGVLRLFRVADKLVVPGRLSLPVPLDGGTHACVLAFVRYWR